METKLTEQEILSRLSQHIGTEEYHRFSALSKLVMTDGVKDFCDLCQCFWLLDVIMSYQHTKILREKGEFQVWRIWKTGDTTATVSCDDGNENILITQKIEYTDFPLQSFKLYCSNGVIFLPSEY